MKPVSKFEQETGACTCTTLTTESCPACVTPHLEADLLTEHAKVIKQFDEHVHDYAIYPCACCERLHKRSCVKEVYLMISNQMMFGLG